MPKHGTCCSDSEHDHSDELGIQYSLYTKINIENVQCLNEAVEGSGRKVFKAWENRFHSEDFVESDVDEELLFNIPFTGIVKLKGILIIGADDDTHPSKMRLFKNRPSFSFDDARSEPDEQFELHPDPTGCLEYSLRVVKFSSVHHLTVHFPKNFGAESTKVYYIGLRGEFTRPFRQEVLICSYESAPNIADHRVESFKIVPQEIH